MRSKLHFGVLIILMVFLGRYMETSVVPNQQILIQFSDAKITENEAQNAIEAIQLKLQTIGVSAIKVDQGEKGQLKITYYSETDIQQIEDVLSSEGDFRFSHKEEGGKSNENPIDKRLKNYELNISEIQKSFEVNWDLEGAEIVELNHKSDRFNNLNDYNANGYSQIKILHNYTKAYVRLNNNIALVEDNHSYKIPEVRAGPHI